jgi:PhnB protein
MADEPKFAPIEVYLTVDGGDAASKFYQHAFGATETFRQLADDGKRLMHCNLSMFGGQIMLSDDFSESSGKSSPGGNGDGGPRVTIHINLSDAATVDATMANAAKAGARITMPPADQFWGAHYGQLVDPFGHHWSFASPSSAQPPVQSP